jgi:iduronate 2-sulfatase
VKSLLALALLLGTATAQAVRPNVLFIAIDDLRNDLGALGASHAKTPQLDAFAGTARTFSRHYTQVPTCGASRAALLRGRYPQVPAHVGNQAIAATSAAWAERSLPALFRREGYTTLALGKITHHPGGLTGKNWAEGREELPGGWERHWVPDSPWKTPLDMMHGFAHGTPRQSGASPPTEAQDGPDHAYPDAWVADDAVKTLATLTASERPWFFSVGFFKPHLPFAAPKRWHDLHAQGVPALAPEAAAKPGWPSGWHASSEFRRNYGHAGRDPANDPEYAALLRQAYAASISYVDAQIGRVLAALDASPAAARTIVVVWSDHGFLLGEHAIWGKHCLYEHALRSPLMIRHPGLPAPGQTTTATVETIDILPTLAELCQISPPAELDGRSLRPMLDDPAAPSAKPALGFWTNGARTLRNDRWRIISQPARGETPAHVELFDYLHDPDETRNHAKEQPAVVAELLETLSRYPAP